jgi:hypothetical protein
MTYLSCRKCADLLYSTQLIRGSVLVINQQLITRYRSHTPSRRNTFDGSMFAFRRQFEYILCLWWERRYHLRIVVPRTKGRPFGAPRSRQPALPRDREGGQIGALTLKINELTDKNSLPYVLRGLAKALPSMIYTHNILSHYQEDCR